MKFKVLSNLKHSGKSYLPGDEIELEDKFSEPLVNDGILEPLKEESGTVSSDVQNTNTQEQTTESESQEKDEFEGISYKELKAKAKEKGVKASGSAEEIKTRLRK